MLNLNFETCKRGITVWIPWYIILSVKIIIFNLIYGFRGFNINLRFIKKVFQNFQIFGDVKNFGKSIMSTFFTFFDGFFELLQSITGSFQSTLFTETIFILSVSWFFWWNCTLKNSFLTSNRFIENLARIRAGIHGIRGTDPSVDPWNRVWCRVIGYVWQASVSFSIKLKSNLIGIIQKRC